MLRCLLAGLFFSAALYSDVITDVRTAIERNDFALGDSYIKSYRQQHGVTPELLEAVSWLGRGALAAKHYDAAIAYAKETEQLAAAELKNRKLDAEPQLPVALGAAIEVQAQVLNARGQHQQAIAFLHQQLRAYAGTSIVARLQKNLNLLSLEGKPAPPLEETQFIGPQPHTLASLHGKPVILFFWAHWCGDCKLQRRELSQVTRDYADKGLVLIGPTQLYGYAARGEDATPAQEMQYIDQVRTKYYADLPNMAVPVSERDLKLYGASTTPTLVFIDRKGIVRVYHPGRMTLDEMRAAIAKIV